MEDKSLSKEQLQEQQKDINNKFDSIQQQLKDTKELNKELMDPLDLDNTKMLEESIDQELENAKEPLLRAGHKPTADGWPKGAKSEARIFTGEDSKSYPSENGNYVKFYQAVKAGLQTGVMPISGEMILQVAKIIDQARKISIR